MKFYQTRKGEIISLDNVLTITSLYQSIIVTYKDTDKSATIKVPSDCSTKATLEAVACILRKE